VGANGVALKYFTALVDSGAGVTATINPKFEKALVKKCLINVVRLQTPIRVRGFTKGVMQLIEKGFIGSLVIDGRVFRIPFLFCDTGRYNIFIRQRFFEAFGGLINLKKQ